MADRKLSIAVKADLREGQKLTKYLTDLATIGSRVAKSFSSIVLGGGGPTGTPGQRIALGKTLQEDIKLMKALGAEGEKFGKVMKSMVASETEKLSKSIKSMTDNLKEFTNAASEAEAQLKEMIETGASPEAIAAQRGTVDKWQQKVSQNAADLKVAHQRDAELNPQKQPWWRRDLLGGQGTQQILSQLGLGGLARYAGVAGIGIAAYQATDDFFTTRTQMANQVMQNRLMSADRKRLAMELAQGNAGAAVAFQESNTFNRGELLDVIQATVGEAQWKHVKGALTNFISAKPGATVSEIGEFATSHGANAALIDQAMTAFRRNLQSANVPQQTMLQAGQQQAGVMRALGRAAFGTANSREAEALYARELGGVGMKGANDYNLNLEAGTTANVHMQLIGRVGRAAASKLVGAAASAIASGMDELAAIGVMAAYAGVRGGNIMSALRGVTGDANIAGILAQGSAQFAGAQFAYLPGDAGVAAMGFGIGDAGPAGMARRAQQGILGAQSVSSLLTGGSDNWQRTINLVNATRAAGPGASVYTSSALTRLGQDYNLVAKMMAPNAKATEEMEALGVTVPMLREYVKSTSMTPFARILRDPATAGLPGVGIIQQIEKSGKSLHDFFKGMDPDKRDKMIRQVGAVLSVGDTADYATPALGAAAVYGWAGLGEMPAKGKGFGVGTKPKTGDALDAVSSSAQTLRESLDLLKKSVDEFALPGTLGALVAGWLAHRHELNMSETSMSEEEKMKGLNRTPKGQAQAGHRDPHDQRPPPVHHR